MCKSGKFTLQLLSLREADYYYRAPMPIQTIVFGPPHRNCPTEKANEIASNNHNLHLAASERAVAENMSEYDDDAKMNRSKIRAVAKSDASHQQVLGSVRRSRLKKGSKIGLNYSQIPWLSWHSTLPLP